MEHTKLYSHKYTRLSASRTFSCLDHIGSLTQENTPITNPHSRIRKILTYSQRSALTIASPDCSEDHLSNSRSYSILAIHSLQPFPARGPPTTTKSTTHHHVQQHPPTTPNNLLLPFTITTSVTTLPTSLPRLHRPLPTRSRPSNPSHPQQQHEY